MWHQKRDPIVNADLRSHESDQGHKACSAFLAQPEFWCFQSAGMKRALCEQQSLTQNRVSLPPRVPPHTVRTWMRLAYWNCAVLKFSAATLALFFFTPSLLHSPMTEYPLCSEPLKECRAAGNPGTDMNGWTVLHGGTGRASWHKPFHPVSKGTLKVGHGDTVASPQLVLHRIYVCLWLLDCWCSRWNSV